METCLLHRLREEKSMRLKGGIYHQTQIKLAYNSNRIEDSKLSEEQTRYIFETNTSDSRKEWFKAGDYKIRPNTVGDNETTAPVKVRGAIAALLDSYYKTAPMDFAALVDFHYRFEKIHPFQDSNGRVGRIILLKNVLRIILSLLLLKMSIKCFTTAD